MSVVPLTPKEIYLNDQNLPSFGSAGKCMSILTMTAESDHQFTAPPLPLTEVPQLASSN